MHFVKAIFSCILLFQAAFCTVPLPTKTPPQQKQVTSGGSSSTGCGNVHVNNYCSGPDEEIKAQLLKIRTQLADIQQKVDSLTGNNSKSGKYNRINAFFWETSNHVLGDLPKGNFSFCVKIIRWASRISQVQGAGMGLPQNFHRAWPWRQRISVYTVLVLFKVEITMIPSSQKKSVGHFTFLWNSPPTPPLNQH